MIGDEEPVEIRNSDIVRVFGLDPNDNDIGRFFTEYLSYNNEIVALAACGFTLDNLNGWKSSETLDYQTLKSEIDKFTLSRIESNMKNQALEGSYKHSELILINNDEKYFKGKKEKGDEVSNEEIIAAAKAKKNKINQSKE